MARILLLAVVLLTALTPTGDAQQRGGSLTYLAAADVDYLDPGQTYYTFGYVVSNATQRTLYSYLPGDASTPVPDLAAAAPTISADRRTITVPLKSGVRFAPPVNREVVAADVKYAIERAFTRNVASGYATAYFADIKGAPSEPGRYRPIRGVQAVDAHTLRLRLKRPVADTLAAALTMPITAPVPKGYARRFDRRNPSTYDLKPAFSGPYVAARKPNRSIRLTRNPNWDAATDFRPAYLDSILIDEGVRDYRRGVRRVVSGSSLVCCDAGQFPTVGVPAEQIATAPAGGTRYIALNTRIKPFNRRAVRRAVLAGMDRSALLRTRAGTAELATHFLPPGLPGFEEAGGAAGFGFDFLANPAGDAALSQAYFRKAGFKRGRYTGRKRLSVVATNADPGRSTARVAARQLRRMGFRLRMRFVSQDRLYTRYCGVPRAAVAICPNVGWFKDYSDPEPMLAPTFGGFSIKRAGNVNWSQLRVGSIDRAMRRAATVPAGPDRNAAWAAIDERITAEAPAVPYAWDSAVGVRSANVNGVFHAFNGAWDLSFTSVG